MKEQNISSSVIKRLPRYYRFLGELKKQGFTRISSAELARRMKLTASQIRQDLNCFGGFGQQGYGYSIENLYDEIGEILGINVPTKAIMMGVGKLGVVVAENMNFKALGFDLIGAFDIASDVVGKKVGLIKVSHLDELEEFCKKNKPEAAFICLPDSAVHSVVNRLVGLGINGFWNFSHCDIAIEHPEASVENVHFSDTLMRLSFKIKNS